MWFLISKYHSNKQQSTRKLDLKVQMRKEKQLTTYLSRQNKQTNKKRKGPRTTWMKTYHLARRPELDWIHPSSQDNSVPKKLDAKKILVSKHRKLRNIIRV